MTQLTIVANFNAKPDHMELVKSELLKLIPLTREEEGCILYDLHQDNTDPCHFMFYETWESRELWQAHKRSKHIAEFLTATSDAVVGYVVNEMTKIDN